jgi:hypothetical protein
LLYLMQISFVRGDYNSANKMFQTIKELFDDTMEIKKCQQS